MSSILKGIFISSFNFTSSKLNKISFFESIKTFLLFSCLILSRLSNKPSIFSNSLIN